jgi:hypothetical protein
MNSYINHLGIEQKTNIRYFILNKNEYLWKAIPAKYGKKSMYTYQSFPISTNKNCKVISWFALNKDKAEYYQKKLKNSIIYKYTINNPIKLFLVNNITNQSIYYKILQNTTEKLNILTSIHINQLSKQLQPHFKHYKYMHMNTVDKSFHEFNFAFGFLSKKEQFKFLKLYLKLQEYNIIPKQTGINNNKSISSYNLPYRIARFILPYVKNDTNKHSTGHRYSIYSIDKHVVHNLCLLLYNIGINGYVYLHMPSDWHPTMKDTTEIAIFNPSKFI